MTLLRFERGSDLLLGEAGAAPRPAQAAAVETSPATWWPRFDALHQRSVGILLLGLLAWAGVMPAWLAGTAGASVLLIGGAVIGIPHGSSDFVVAHRLLRARLGLWWLPAFLAGYLAVVGVTLAGWRFLPGVTFLSFLGVSALHFGATGEEEDGRATGDATLRYLARAATPIVPIFLVHPAAVAGIIGLMSDQPAARIVALLDGIRPGGLVLYAALLGWVVSRAAGDLGRGVGSSTLSREAAELALLALAACLLPPLLVFAVYFCLMHAVRHMAQLGRESHPRDGRAALRLASAIVVPSALAFGLVLAATWDAVAGAFSTTPLLAAALQLTAALTIPHVLLERWATVSRHTLAGPDTAAAQLSRSRSATR